MRKTLLALLVVFVAGPTQAQDTLSLEQVIAVGLEHNYDIRIARNTQRIASNTGDRALTGFLPTLDLSGGYTRNDADTDFDNPPSSTNTLTKDWTSDITLNWTLFDGFAMFANRARYAALARQGEFLGRNEIELSVVAIAEAYFNLVQQQQLLGVLSETRDVSTTRLEREQVRRNLGGASSTDLLNAQVAFNADASALLEQELQVQIARNRLNVLLGQDPSTDVIVSSNFEIPALDLDAEDVISTSLDGNAVLTASESAHRAASRDVETVRASFLPRLNAFVSYGYIDRTSNSGDPMIISNDFASQTTTGRFGLALSLNLFNGLSDKINLSNARLEARNQALAVNDTRNRLIGAVRETYDRFQKRVQIVELEAQNVTAAERNLEVEQDAYALGNATSVDYRDAQVTLTERRATLIRARYQARLARISLDQLMGKLTID